MENKGLHTKDDQRIVGKEETLVGQRGRLEAQMDQNEDDHR